MHIRMVRNTPGPRLTLGLICRDDGNNSLVYQAVQNATEYLAALEIVAFAAEGFPDRLVLTVRAFAAFEKKFVFAGARLDGQPHAFSEADIRTVLLGGPNVTEFEVLPSLSM